MLTDFLVAIIVAFFAGMTFQRFQSNGGEENE